jgi:transposase
MTVSAEMEAAIRRLHFAEHWPVGTIASQLSVHGDVVRRVVSEGEGQEASPATVRGTLVDDYKNFIEETFKTYPRLASTRLFDMLRSRGYEGSTRTLRRYVTAVRPKPKTEAFLHIETLIGEQSQIDWAYVGKVPVPGGERPLWLFVMVLSWSRAMWGEFTFDMSVNSLLRSMVRAAEYFGGSTRQWLFDNPKTVVLERHGDAARFHPKLLQVSGLHLASLRLCGVRMPNQKGRVERSIRYLRERFLAARHIRSIAQGNDELLAFIDEVAHVRAHPTLPEKTVAECLTEERLKLLPLPKTPADTDTVLPVAIDKTAFARFDTNSYSVPPSFAASTLTLCADDKTVRLLDGDKEVARHLRCWGRRQRIEDVSHRQALLEEKRGARQAKGQDRLRSVAPDIDILLARWLELNRNMGSVTAKAVELLSLYGDDIFAQAISAMVKRGLNDPGALAITCEQLRRSARAPIPIDIKLSSHIADKEVIPHSLETYDVKSKRRH